MSTANQPEHRLISSDRVIGTDVYGLGEETIGQIDLLIEKVSGRIAYAIMSFGGFLGLAHNHYPIPWSALTYDTALGGYQTRITESQLKEAPEFSDDMMEGSQLGDQNARTLRRPAILGRLSLTSRIPVTRTKEQRARLDGGLFVKRVGILGGPVCAGWYWGDAEEMPRGGLVGLQMDGARAIRGNGVEDHGGDGPGRNDAEKGDAERARHKSEAVIAVAGHGRVLHA